MTNRKTTKRALLTSVTALALCVVMLVGTTFAWFTDTAKTNVNKIQAGNLKVDIVDKDGRNSLVGQSLKWEKADGHQNEAVLWEPGAEYNLTPFKIANKGNLALKYTITVNGVNGDAKLLEAIDFFVKVGDTAAVELTDLTGILPPAGNATEPVVGEEVVPTTGLSDLIVITGKMKTTAGNEYQGLSIDGLSITVNATQAAYEYDSNNNTYDENADMSPDFLDKMASANVTKKVDATTSSSDTVFEGENVTLTAPAGSVADGEYTLTVTPKSGVDSSVNINIEANQAVKAYDIKLVKDGETTPVAAAEGKEFTVNLFVGKNLANVAVYHKNVKINGASYDENTGYVTFTTTSFSPYTVVYDAPAAIIGGTYYGTLTDAVAAAKGGDTITLVKDSNGKGLWLAAAGEKNITIDFNGHTYAVSELVGSKNSENQAAHFEKGNAVTLKNGTLKVADSAASSAKILVQNYCNLTASNMTFDGTNLMLMSQQPVTLSNNDGTEKFSNCTVIAAKRETAIAVDAAVWGGYAGADVTLDNCTVYGALDVGKYEYDSNKKVYVKTEDLFLKNDGTPCITVINGFYTDLKSAVLAATTDSTITLLDDVVVNETMVVAGKKLTVDLNGKTVSNASDIWNEKTGNWSLFSVRKDGSLTITGNGTLAAKKDDCYAVDVQDGAALTIENGTFVGNIHAVYVLEGTANINGGTYSVQQKYNQTGKEDEFVLNCYDANRKDGTAKIIVTGGTFANFNPADCQAEGARTNFVAEGYISTKAADSNTWTVTKDA